MSLKTFIPFVIFISLILISYSCKYKNDEDLFKYNTIKCDTSNVTYSGTIAPIITANCIQCHGKNTASVSGGVVLDNYSGLVSYINKVWGNINHLPGYDPMPKDADKLPQCEIKQIHVWINEGTPDN